MQTFKAMRTTWAVFLFLCVDAAADTLVEVDSFHDGAGLYTYTFHRGDMPYVWGWMTTNNGNIWMQSYGIREVQDPPGWTHSISASGGISWRPFALPAYLDDPITFSIRSCLAVTTTYTNFWPPGIYPLGGIVGEVYELPGRTNFVEGGYQNFIFTGPALPTLSAGLQGSQLVLSWPTLARECNLERCDALLRHPVWQSVTNSPSTVGTNFTVTLPAAASSGMFRLAIPNLP
jgi:hypothetical protein